MMEKRSIKVMKTLMLMVAGIFFFNCTYAEAASKEKSKAEVKSEETAAKDKPSATITKGMPKAEVLKLLGEPDSIEKMKASDGGYVEFWRYKRVVGQKEEFQVTGAEMVEQWSPSLGEFIEVPEEIEQLVTTTVSQLVEIIMHEDKVLTFKADLQQDIDVSE